MMDDTRTSWEEGDTNRHAGAEFTGDRDMPIAVTADADYHRGRVKLTRSQAREMGKRLLEMVEQIELNTPPPWWVNDY